MRTKKRALSVILTLLSVFIAAAGTGCSSPEASGQNSPSGSYTITSRPMQYHVMAPSPYTSGDVDVYFMNGSDVPYLEAEDWITIQKNPLMTFGAVGYDISLSKEGDLLNVIRFDDYNSFVSTGNSALLDLVISVRKDEAGNQLYMNTLDSSVRKYGHEKVMDLGYYDIDLVRDGDKYYIPLQTLSDLFFAPLGRTVIYNGECIYVYGQAEELLRNPDGTLTEAGGLVYGENNEYVTGQISPEMAKFNYDELCFAFDNVYGLKESHHILSFRDLVRETGSDDVFLGTDTRQIDEALCRIIAEGINDIHTKFLLASYASGIDYRNELIEKFGEGRSRETIFSLQAEYSEVRSKYYPDGIPGYEEIGDTAYITFDEFWFAKHNYYSEPVTPENTDTVALISESVQKILRPDSPIKNVVLDLSCNTGGEADAAVYTLAAFLGRASISVEDPNTGALAMNDYVCDTNFDKKFDENDSLAGKGLKLYCLESGVSFSCGNLVPAVFKEDPHVALLGQRSSGGACSICFLSTATGSILRLSSSTRLSYMRNGSFYDIDQGVEPDIFINNPESFYNRQSLTEYIDNIR